MALGIGVHKIIAVLSYIIVWQVQTRNCTYDIGKLSKLLTCFNYGSVGEHFLKYHGLNGAS